MIYGIEENKSTLEYIKSLNILCVEDDKTTQVLYEALLEDVVGDIELAYNGEEGYQKFLDKKIDIIITDYDMPILNGLEMMQKIRATNQNIPIILVSAIEQIEVLTKAIEHGVKNFVKKPIIKYELVDALKHASQHLMANDFIQEQRKKELEVLEAKNSYSSYQEDLAFAKELNILRNDFYYQLLDANHISLVDFLYQPLDVISGDAYTARRIDEYRTFYLIVDGMGKGLSASLTAMIMTSFINHLIDRMKEYDSFSLDILIKESIGYIKPILLDEEAVAVDYILFDTAYNTLSYSKFAMPAILMQNNQGEVVKLKSNNPPLSKWQSDYKINEHNVKDIDKFLFYSDGIVENMTKSKDTLYGEFIEEDFISSFTREEFKSKFFDKIDKPEDDITLIFINRLPLENALFKQKSFSTSLSEVENASEWYRDVIQEMLYSSQIINETELVFTELFMNAYEHGNLGIDSLTKNKLISEDSYYETLQEKEQNCSKKIDVKVSTLCYGASCYVITQVTDEGKGFDTQILSEIFRNSQTFNGRGVFISRKNSLGIYYNSKGNSVLYLNKITKI